MAGSPLSSSLSFCKLHFLVLVPILVGIFTEGVIVAAQSPTEVAPVPQTQNQPVIFPHHKHSNAEDIFSLGNHYFYGNYHRSQTNTTFLTLPQTQFQFQNQTTSFNPKNYEFNKQQQQQQQYGYGYQDEPEGFHNEEPYQSHEPRPHHHPHRHHQQNERRPLGFGGILGPAPDQLMSMPMMQVQMQPVQIPVVPMVPVRPHKRPRPRPLIPRPPLNLPQIPMEQQNQNQRPGELPVKVETPRPPPGMEFGVTPSPSDFRPVPPTPQNIYSNVETESTTTIPTTTTTELIIPRIEGLNITFWANGSMKELPDAYGGLNQEFMNEAYKLLPIYGINLYSKTINGSYITGSGGVLPPGNLTVGFYPYREAALPYLVGVEFRNGRSISDEELRTRLELIATKFHSIQTRNSSFFVGPQAAELNREKNYLALTVLETLKVGQNGTGSSEANAVLESAQEANSRYAGTVWGICLESARDLASAMAVYPEANQIRNKVNAEGLQLGVLLEANVCEDFTINGNNMTELQTVVLQLSTFTDFFVCDVFPLSGQSETAAGNVIERFGKVQEGFRELAPNLEVILRTGINGSGSTGNGNEDFRQFWKKMENYGLENRQRIFMREAFDANEDLQQQEAEVKKQFGYWTLANGTEFVEKGTGTKAFLPSMLNNFDSENLGVTTLQAPPTSYQITNDIYNNNFSGEQ